VTIAAVSDEAARTWFGSTISGTQLPSRVAHWFLTRGPQACGMGAGRREVEPPRSRDHDAA
jgi:hypothetical protein